MRRIKKFDSEENLQVMVADYLRLQYPNILFHSDFGSGIKLTIGQAAKQKRQNGGRRAWPDMFIARHKMLPVANEYAPNGYDVRCFGGLFLELKKDGTKLKREKDCKNILKCDTRLRKAGDWWDQHIEEQAEKLEQLRDEGYRAEFAVGFEEAKKIIDGYLS